MKNPFNYRFGLPSPFYDNEVGSSAPLPAAAILARDNTAVLDRANSIIEQRSA